MHPPRSPQRWHRLASQETTANEWIKRAHPTLTILTFWRSPWHSWISAPEWGIWGPCSRPGSHKPTHSHGRWPPRSLCPCNHSRRPSRTGSSSLRAHRSLASTWWEMEQNQIKWTKSAAIGGRDVLYSTKWVSSGSQSATLLYLSETWICEHKTTVSPQK